MERQLFVRGKKLTAFLLQQPFGRQPHPPFLRQPLCDVHRAFLRFARAFWPRESLEHSRNIMNAGLT